MIGYKQECHKEREALKSFAKEPDVLRLFLIELHSTMTFMTSTIYFNGLMEIAILMLLWKNSQFLVKSQNLSWSWRISKRRRERKEMENL
ncbi:uncharacterized protein MONOS_10607 [Monocercomonoides exilis]|uniref:uncharacterized protein n=1 Tax=Monocercomonoides exilis TaxID=2049356 RepID=UPI0035596B06|nr:hypothetical protein MONOS_10607 [Monocercomonoides exilis]|eukprot:MONOS_10607.1-p1 / transcript=MONOS_10607.1 / gene=MONOS_10607 / organism=Monocercomonoides_exilis_PA203 / gene_product=unspecified product / transcript_product=unspecified product / location=Mono_scaffold00489:3758-4270(+) / protein_length=90 / sequence_SO=supercontig / SO=protein_coding / is_pseudo=false